MRTAGCNRSNGSSSQCMAEKLFAPPSRSTPQRLAGKVVCKHMQAQGLPSCGIVYLQHLKAASALVQLQHRLCCEGAVPSGTGLYKNCSGQASGGANCFILGTEQLLLCLFMGYQFAQ